MRTPGRTARAMSGAGTRTCLGFSSTSCCVLGKKSLRVPVPDKRNGAPKESPSAVYSCLAAFELRFFYIICTANLCHIGETSRRICVILGQPTANLCHIGTTHSEFSDRGIFVDFMVQVSSRGPEGRLICACASPCVWTCVQACMGIRRGVVDMCIGMCVDMCMDVRTDTSRHPTMTCSSASASCSTISRAVLADTAQAITM